MSGDGSILKATKDFTKEVDSAIPEAEKLAQVQAVRRIAKEFI
jgi:26S proteasome regulatory subunit N5